MLNKICLKDGVDLVNIVRSDEQSKILKDIGAKHVVDSSKPTFMEDLIAALTATGATLAFDAIGGGKLAGQILAAMEISLNSRPGSYSRYGSSTHKQVYIYGRLSLEPTILGAAYGMAWGVGGFLLTPFLQKVGMEEAGKMRARSGGAEKHLPSHYTRRSRFHQALDVETSATYKRVHGEKYLTTEL